MTSQNNKHLPCLVFICHRQELWKNTRLGSCRRLVYVQTENREMDVDSDLDSKLLQQFSSMGTTDKDVLIAEFQTLLGNQLNSQVCAFFLDMNNWNLQAAICSYYDFEQPNVKLPCMRFVQDVTIGEGEGVPPSTRFTKTWKVQNTGDEKWPPGCCLKFVAGDQLGPTERVMVEALEPEQYADISVNMFSPSISQTFQGQWKMCTPTGLYFGEVIWVIITVEETGLLGVTQQLSKMGGELSHISSSQHMNPFASPTKSTPPGSFPQSPTSQMPGSMFSTSVIAESDGRDVTPTFPQTLLPPSPVSLSHPHHQPACQGLPSHQMDEDAEMS